MKTPSNRRLLIAFIVLLIVIIAAITSVSCESAMIVTKIEPSRNVSIDSQPTYNVWVKGEPYMHTTILYKVGDTLKIK